jgi:ribonucleoside-diphosphate reductase alpha chain
MKDPKVGFYQPDGLALEIFQKRYALHAGETWLDACTRVSNHVAAAEHGNALPLYGESFYSILARNLFMPGGRIWYGSGRPKGQLLNCFVVPTADSREGWGKTVSDMIIITGTGGGLGVNCSPVRPRGTSINGSGGFATGSVSLMEIINAAGEVIKAGGGRRTALMLALSSTHGDIVEFLMKKLDKKQLTNANVSVWFEENPEHFFEKVRKEEMYELKFRGKVVGEVYAPFFWSTIVWNALQGGEPGLLNGYYANRMSNVGYLYPLVCTNPCGEIFLPPYGCCDLGSLVLPRFIVNYGGKEFDLDWGLLRQVVELAVRFLDNVLTVNNYPLAEIKETCSNERRIGLGVTGLATMLLMMGMRYNSPQALEFVDKLMNFIKNSAYEASVNLSEEKGSFPKFDAEQFLKGGFAKNLKPSIKEKIRKHGIRNCALLDVAPNGTNSMVCNVDSGIEPSFGPGWLRRFRDGDALREEVVIHPLYRKMLDDGADTSHFQSASELSIRDHLEMQRTCQKHVDNAISKTINLPPGTSEKDLSELYMEYFPELKGITVYPMGSREDQPVTPMTEVEVRTYLDYADRGIGVADGQTSQDSCKNGVCEL